MSLLNKTLLAATIAASLGATSVANAAAVTSWQLSDFDGDGLTSDFNFFSPPPGNGPNAFTGDLGPIAMGVENAPGSFSTGFNFGGTGQFVPFVGNSAGTGSVTADIDAAGNVTFGSLDFAGTFGGQNFFLAPDVLSTANTTATDLGGGNYGVIVTYISTINNPASPFNGFQANWRLEGVMSTVPVPAAVWLFGSGLLGLVGVARRRAA